MFPGTERVEPTMSNPASPSSREARPRQEINVAPDSLQVLGSNETRAQHRLEARIAALPESARPYADKYFLNTEEILKSEGLNPWVRAQVMIRKGPGEVGGITEALAQVVKYSDFARNGGRAFALSDGDSYNSSETLLVLEGRIQDIVALETMYLGVISAESTLLTEGKNSIDLEEVKTRMTKVCDTAEGRPVIYFGARHWRYDEDRAISSAAFEGGASAASTDAGASSVGKVGIGTIPHVLENIYAWKVGREAAVVEATKAFDRVIDREVPRIALIDYANREISDSLATANALRGRLHGVRVDTCGENIAQGALTSGNGPEAAIMRAQGLNFPRDEDADSKYWYGSGVTISGVFALRQALDCAGYEKVQIVLSSGFGSANKVAAFVRAEKILGIKLFDSLGVGGVYDSRSAKMDIVRVGNSAEDWREVSKVGRKERLNPRLREVDLTQIERLLTPSSSAPSSTEQESGAL